MRSADLFQLVTTPSRLLLMIASSEDSTIAASERDRCSLSRSEDFGCLSLGNIDYRREHHRSFICVDRVQTDLDRELAAVLLATVEIAPRAHRSRQRISEKCRAKSGMLATETLGHEHFDRSPQEFGPRVTEYLLGLGIYQSDQTFAVDHHHGVRGRLDNELETAITLTSGVHVHPLARGPVQ